MTVSAAQVPTQTPRQKKAKQPKVVTEEPVVIEEPEPQAQEEPVVTEVEQENSFESRLNVVRESFEELTSELTNRLKALKSIEQELKKLSVLAKKEFKKKTKKSKKGLSNSGFNAPVLISDELASFLKVPKGTVLRPPQVSSLISKYANDHGLKEDSNRAIYKCDHKMSKLLGPAIHPIKKSDPTLGNGVSIFNLNSYLKRHFTKIEKSA
jgi:chromatin remodeling complex protein RSC6